MSAEQPRPPYVMAVPDWVWFLVVAAAVPMQLYLTSNTAPAVTSLNSGFMGGGHGLVRPPVSNQASAYFASDRLLSPTRAQGVHPLSCSDLRLAGGCQSYTEAPGGSGLWALG